MSGGHGDDGGKFHPFDVQPSHLAYAILGGFVVLFGMFSLLIKEKLYLGEAPIATIFGIIIGPYAIGLFDPRAWGGGDVQTSNAITLEVTRVVLAIGVFAIGVELPSKYMRKHWKSLFFLLVPIMTYGWFVAAGLIYALIPGLSFLSSLVIGACLTPTDPILAAAVVGGKYANKHVPAHLRHILTAESGCNDGAAFPFLFIALYLTLEKSDGKAVGEWFYITWLYEVTLGIVFGAALGYAFRHLMKFCERKNLIDRHSYVAQYISLAMLAIGSTTLLGSDDLLAAFSCGTAFAWDGWFNKQTEESQFSNVIDLLFNCACFIYIGAWFPFKDFNAPELTINPWRLVLIGILVLLLRRLPAVIALYRWIPDIKTFREALFSGHFGPMGVGAVFISTLASTKLPDPVYPPTNQVELLAGCVQPIVAFMVLCSIVTHGLSIPFFSLGRRVHSVTYTYTWSRRQSIDPQHPEWANQVRRLPSRREDIVINRDDTEKRNLAGEDNIERILSEKTISESEATGTAGASGSGEDSGTRTPGEGEIRLQREERDITDARGPETMQEDDDDEGPREWREGRDLIVEARARPGEEPEVKVFKDVFTDEESGTIASDLADQVRAEITTFRKAVRLRSKGLLDESQIGTGRLMQALSGVRALAKDTPDPSLVPPGQGAEDYSIFSGAKLLGRKLEKQPQRPETGTTEDGEWNDEPIAEADKEDNNNGTEGGHSPTVVIEEPPKPTRDVRSTSPPGKSRKKHHHIAALVPKRTRRRDSVRRALFSTGRGSKGKSGEQDGSDEAGSSAEQTPAGSPRESIVDLPGTEEGTRGRSELPRLGSGIPPSRRSSMRPPTRVASRNASPAASRIRFADDPDPPAGTGIMRSYSGLIHSTTASPDAAAQSPGSGNTSPILLSPTDSNRVAFDLPPSK